MNLELIDEQTEALIQGLRKLIDDDRYPLSPRLAVLREILATLKPEPERQRPVPRRHYGSPSKGRFSRRR